MIEIARKTHEKQPEFTTVLSPPVSPLGKIWDWLKLEFRPVQSFDEPLRDHELEDIQDARSGDRQALARIWKSRSRHLAGKLRIYCPLWDNPEKEGRKVRIKLLRDGDEELQEIAIEVLRSIRTLSKPEGFVGWLYRVGQRTMSKVRGKARKRGLAGYPKGAEPPVFVGIEAPNDGPVPNELLTYQPFQVLHQSFSFASGGSGHVAKTRKTYEGKPLAPRPQAIRCIRCNYLLCGDDAIRNHPARCPGGN